MNRYLPQWCHDGIEFTCITFCSNIFLHKNNHKHFHFTTARCRSLIFTTNFELTIILFYLCIKLMLFFFPTSQPFIHTLNDATLFSSNSFHLAFFSYRSICIAINLIRLKSISNIIHLRSFWSVSALFFKLAPSKCSLIGIIKHSFVI